MTMVRIGAGFPQMEMEKLPVNQKQGRHIRTKSHYPLAFQENGKVISQVFNVGRITYLLTDLRSEKEGHYFRVIVTKLIRKL